MKGALLGVFGTLRRRPRVIFDQAVVHRGMIHLPWTLMYTVSREIQGRNRNKSNQLRAIDAACQSTGCLRSQPRVLLRSRRRRPRRGTKAEFPTKVGWIASVA